MEAAAVVLLGDHPLVLILFRDVPLRYGDSAEHQVGSRARERIRLGEWQPRTARPATLCSDEDAEAPAGRCPHRVDPTREHFSRMRAHAPVHDLRDRELGKRVVRVNLRVDVGRNGNGRAWPLRPGPSWMS